MTRGVITNLCFCKMWKTPETLHVKPISAICHSRVRCCPGFGQARVNFSTLALRGCSLQPCGQCRWLFYTTNTRLGMELRDSHFQGGGRGASIAAGKKSVGAEGWFTSLHCLEVVLTVCQGEHILHVNHPLFVGFFSVNVAAVPVNFLISLISFNCYYLNP